ncbi:hypothetical protein HPP92_005160 [Vanilla planifolia]|uniref:Uncharacterized protein n=1 Tax=Vanilla planifolia TaxID=51239 RepID=A0A835RTV9_VANPL|nr:hypothetical protein HPP92_005160 [Vanilla planifolia]
MENRLCLLNGSPVNHTLFDPAEDAKGSKRTQSAYGYYVNRNQWTSNVGK